MNPDFFRSALEGSTIKVMGLDPGQTTGACVFSGSSLLDACQLPTSLMPYAPGFVRDYISLWTPDVIIMEDYRIYSWKSDEHKWAGLHTPQLIGAIRYMCWNEGRELHLQMAQQGKAFVTDDRLKEWDLYRKGERHARDAMRHACHYLLFKVAKVQEGVERGT